jgi:hypothetical protein
MKRKVNSLIKKLERMIEDGNSYLKLELSLLKSVYEKYQNDSNHLYNLEKMVSDIEDLCDDIRTSEYKY